MNPMPDLEGDFSTVVDGTASISVERCGGGTTAISSALRAPREAIVQSEVSFAAAEWVFFLPELADRVSGGDRIIEANGNCWRVVRSRTTREHGPVRCDAFLERFDGILTDLIDISQEVDSGQWRTVRPAVAARVQLVETLTDEGSGPPVPVSRYRLLLEQKMSLDSRHRLRLATGELLQVDAFRPSGPTLPLSEVEATRLPPAEE